MERLRFEFGRDLGHLLDDSGVPMTAVATRAGIATSTISRLVAGTREPSFETLSRIALAIGGEVSIRIVPGSGVGVGAGRRRWWRR